jgi:hypothetical protein
MPSTVEPRVKQINRTEKLTQAKVEELPLPPSGDYTVRDSENRALGLAVRVYASGAKSWIVQKKLVGKPYRHVIGPFPLLSHKQAIAAARPVATQLWNQIDPKLDEKRQRAETEKLQAREKRTVGVAFQEYLDHAKDTEKDDKGQQKKKPEPRLVEAFMSARRND